jgi:hypothetical protein
MDDLRKLSNRARELKQRIAELLRSFGPGLVPQLQQLHEELAQIEKRLQALGRHAADDDERGVD